MQIVNLRTGGLEVKKVKILIKFPEDINRDQVMGFISNGDLEKIPEEPRDELKKLKLPRLQSERGWSIKEKEGEAELFLFIISTFYSKKSYDEFIDGLRI